MIRYSCSSSVISTTGAYSATVMDSLSPFCLVTSYACGEKTSKAVLSTGFCNGDKGICDHRKQQEPKCVRFGLYVWRLTYNGLTTRLSSLAEARYKLCPRNRLHSYLLGCGKRRGRVIVKPAAFLVNKSPHTGGSTLPSPVPFVRASPAPSIVELLRIIMMAAVSSPAFVLDRQAPSPPA